MTTAVSFPIRPVTADTDFARCFPVLRELRTSLSPDTFLAVMHGMRQRGYFLVMAESAGEVVAVAGYRFSEHLARGTFMYVDDLVTAAFARRGGHAARLIAWLVKKAKTEKCAELHLDSGVQRTEAHAFYEKVGMRYSSRHYSLKLK